MNMFARHRFTILWVLVVSLAVVNCFVNLGNFEVETWDEARHALNAFEMLQSHQYIAMTYNGQLDYWNLKPPLGAWLIVLGYKLLGVNLWGLRLFSALSAVATVILTMAIARRFDDKVALTSGLILSTMYAFLAFHTARYADYDAPMAFLMTLCVWGMLLWTENRRWGLWLASLAVSLSFLLKSFTAAMPLLFLVVIVFTEKRYQKLSPGDIVLSLLLMTVPVLLWAWFRYQVDGWTFFQRMVGYDLVKRSGEAIEGHPGSNLHYLEPLFFKTLLWSLFLFFVIPFMGFKISWQREPKQLTFRMHTSGFESVFFWAWLGSTLLFPLLVKTKSDWYLNPFYPALSVFLAWHLWHGESSLPWVQKLTTHRLSLILWTAGITEIILLLLVVFPGEWVFATGIRSFPPSQRLLLSLWKTPTRPEKASLHIPIPIDQSERFIVKAFLQYPSVSIDEIPHTLSAGTPIILAGPTNLLQALLSSSNHAAGITQTLTTYQDWAAILLTPGERKPSF